MQTTPKGFRLHIGIFGRRNVGKSSFLNALTRQQSSIVSELAGTTTDPVEKPMELLPIGPVQFIDTAGIDDEGALGSLRIQKTKEIFDRTEIGIVVSTETQQNGAWSVFEQQIINELQKRNVPILFVFNKSDLAEPSPETVDILCQASIPFLCFNAITGQGISELRNALIQTVPEDFLTPPPIVSDLVPPGELIVLVVPVDKEAPKGRLILPQVQTIRDILDAHQFCLVVQDAQLKEVLARIQPPPALVVTDSQAFAQVAAHTPESILMTSFSILFARQKGNLSAMVEGARSIARLRSGSKILVAESCTHHPIGEDIGTVKIPQLLRKFVGGELKIRHVQGHDFPIKTLTEYDLVIHCGACMWNRREILSRQMHCQTANVPMTNYGLAIAFLLGIFDRALKPFNKMEIK
jgi:[FeFe] hydrogenase H-cluster maturation GTPase HydF